MNATAVALALLACASVLRVASAAAAPKGTTIHYNAELSALLIKYPDGKTSNVALASTLTHPPPIKVGGDPALNMRETFVLPGTASADGSLAFNPANANSPADTKPANDKPRVIVTDLTTAKVVGTVSVPDPGIKGCNFFAARVVANRGLTDNFSYDGRYVAAGSVTAGSVPLWLVLQCPHQQTYLARYSYSVKAKKLSYTKLNWRLDAKFLGTYTPNAFIYASSKVGGASGLYAIGSRYSTGQVAVFKLRSAGNWGKVALVDAGVTTDSPCRGFVFTDVAKHTLAAICGPELAELTQAGGYQGIAYSEFLYWSSLAARPGGSDGVRAQLTGVTVPIDGSTATVNRFLLPVSGPADKRFEYNLPSAAYARSVVVVDY